MNANDLETIADHLEDQSSTEAYQVAEQLRTIAHLELEEEENVKEIALESLNELIGWAMDAKSMVERNSIEAEA